MGLEELDQFDLLEEKIELLISQVGSLSEKKGALERNVNGQEQKINSLTKEIEAFKIDRGLIRKRIATLLEKIERFTS